MALEPHLPLLQLPVVTTIVPSISMMASAKKLAGCFCQTLSRASSIARALSVTRARAPAARAVTRTP